MSNTDHDKDKDSGFNTCSDSGMCSESIMECPVFGNRILISFALTQLLGSFATFLGLFFLVTKTSKPVYWWGIVPVGIAFAISITLGFIEFCFEKLRVKTAVNFIFAAQMCNIVLLGILVYLTGGAKESVFTPVFLLIPSVSINYFETTETGVLSLLSGAVFLGFSFYSSSGWSFSVSILLYSLTTLFCIAVSFLCYIFVEREKKKFCENDSACRRLKRSFLTKDCIQNPEIIGCIED